MGDRGRRLTSAWNDASPASHVRLRAVLCVLILPVSLFPTFTSGSCAGSPCLNNGTCVPVTSSSSHHSSLPVRLRCPEGWIRQGGSCYKFHINDRKSWEEARQTCREESSELVSIETLEENRFLRALTVNGLYQGSLDECPANNTLFYNNKTYTASLEKLTQSQASQVCQGKGGHLVAPKDAESYARVVFLKNCLDRTEQFWLGLMFDEVNGRWVFSDGTEASGFQSWAPGEPNNKSRLCSYIVRGNRGDSRADQWADAYCDQFSFSYVCEVDGDVSGGLNGTETNNETGSCDVKGRLCNQPGEGTPLPVTTNGYSGDTGGNADDNGNGNGDDNDDDETQENGDDDNDGDAADDNGADDDDDNDADVGDDAADGDGDNDGNGNGDDDADDEIQGNGDDGNDGDVADDNGADDVDNDNDADEDDSDNDGADDADDNVDDADSDDDGADGADDDDDDDDDDVQDNCENDSGNDNNRGNNDNRGNDGNRGNHDNRGNNDDGDDTPGENCNNNQQNDNDNSDRGNNGRNDENTNNGRGKRSNAGRSQIESTAIPLSTVAVSRNDSFWTSGTDETSEGVFKWNATGRNVTADGWKEGEPNGGRNENCIELRKQHNFLWNDARCEHRNFFICEIGTQSTWAVEPEWTDKDADYQCRCQPGYSGELCDVPPEEGLVGLWPLSQRRGADDISGFGNHGNASGIQLAEGPLDDSEGAFYFAGNSSSFVEIPNNGALDVRRDASVTVLAHVYPMGESGLIVNYPVSSEGCTLWQLANNSLFGSFALDPIVLTASVLKPNKWNYVGVTYDVTSGKAKLWHQGEAVDSEPIGNTELNISGPIRLGYRDGDLESRAFHGRIACLQIYNYALEQRQIRTARHACDGALPEVTMTCEGQVMKLSCSSLTRPFIYVEYASYGRTGMGCGGISDNFSLNCSAQDALQIVSNRCNGLPECSMIAVNDNFGGDPCPGTLKYLEVRMKCVAGPPDGYAPAPTGLLTSFHTDLPPTTVTATSGPPITNVTVNSTTSEYATTMDVNVTTSPLPSGATMSTESRCPATRKRNILWPETARGVWSSQPCPNGTVGTARWYCEGPTRKGEPDLSNCTSPWVNELYDLLNAGGPAGDILALISGNLISQGTVYGGDVIRSIDLLNVLVQRQEEQLVNMTEEERKSTVTSFTQTMTLCGSTLLRSDIGSAWDDIPEDNWSQVATGVIDSAEGSGFLVAKSLPDETFSSVQDNLVLEVLPATGDSRRFPSGLSSEWNDVTDSVSLPATNQQVVALLYNDSLGTYLKPKDANRTVNSRVISASLGNGSTSGQLGDNQKVTIVLQHTNAENASVRNPTCSFWNFSNGGSWSSKGCTKTKESNETHTICECDHLTNFAILMDISGQGFTEADRFALSIITWVGCIISIVCLVFAICIFLGSRRVRCQRTVIHANLCICLLLAEALFLAGVDKTEDKVACEVIAVVLHYLFLASFTWMCLEGVQLYILLIKVFKTQRSRMVYFYLFGYGVPAVMVGVSVAVNFSDNLNGYVTDRYCWLNAHKFFIWSFVGPALLIVLINFGFLIIALRVVYSHKSGKKMKHFKTGTKFKSWIRGSLTLLCLLGVTWVFGVLYLDSGTIVFAYVFAITNSLQGMFIFIFHCLLNEKVQGELIRCFAQCACCPEFLRQKYLERGSGTYVHHSGQSHRLHQNTLKTDSSGSTTSTRLNNTLDNHKVPLAITNGIKRRNVDVAIPEETIDEVEGTKQKQGKKAEYKLRRVYRRRDNSYPVELDTFSSASHHSALAPVESKPFEKGSYYPHPGYREPHPGYREFSHSWEMTSLPEKKHPASPYRGEVRNGTVNFQIDI